MSPIKPSQNYVESDVENNNVEIDSNVQEIKPSGLNVAKIPAEINFSTSSLTRISEESQSPRTDYDTDSIDQSSVFVDHDKLFDRDFKTTNIENKALGYDTDSLDQSRVFIEHEQLSGENQRNGNESVKNEKISNENEEHDIVQQDLVTSKESEILGNVLPSPMDVLKMFLINKGPQYSSQTEFLTFFALPFVNSPEDHPSFENLFQVRKC